MVLSISNLLRQSFSRISPKLCTSFKGPSPENFHPLLCSSEFQSPCLVPAREFACRVKRRHTHPRMVWPVKRRERNDQELSTDNEEFIKQVVMDRLGPVPTPGGTGMPYVSPLKQIVQERGEWAPRSLRTGVIAKKLGSYPMWNKNGRKVLSTILQVADNHVIRYLPPDVVQRNYGSRFNEGLGLLIVGADSCDPTIFTKDYCGLFNESGTLPKKKLNRFTITPNAYLPPGTPLYATHFLPGQTVDVFGFTIRRGFQGVMKRWGFKGLRATHGVTKSHRRGGNIGGGGEKGRVWPGTKMPGDMGGEWRCLRKVPILRINTKYNLIWVKGDAIAGGVGAYVTIRDSIIPQKKGEPIIPPFPTSYPQEVEESLSEDQWDASMHNYADPSVLFEEKR